MAFYDRKPKTFSTESESDDDLLEGKLDSSSEEEIGHDTNFAAFKSRIFLSSSSPSTPLKEKQIDSLKGDDLIKANIAQAHPLKSPSLPSPSTATTTAISKTVTETKKNVSTYVYPEITRLSAKPDTTVYPVLVSNITEKPLANKITTTDLTCHNKQHHHQKKNIKDNDEALIREMKDTLGMSDMPVISFPTTNLSSTKGGRFTYEEEIKEKSIPMNQSQKEYFSLTERLATQMHFENQLPNGPVKSMMTQGKHMDLGKWGRSSGRDKPCQKTEVMQHIKDYHNEFYRLLQKQNLVETVRDRIGTVLIVIPKIDALAQLDPTSEETYSILLYHVVISGGMTFQQVEEMYNFETLSGDYVQVEASNGAHYINGNKILLKPDVNCRFRIYHIDRVMDRKQVMEVDDSPYPPEDLPPPLPSTTEEEEEEGVNESDVQPGEEEGGPEEGGEEPVSMESAMRIESTFITTRISAVPRFFSTNNNNNSPVNQNLSLLEKMTTTMNQQFFSATVELKDHLVSLQEKSVTSEIILSTFPTTELFQAYESKRILDINRVPILSHFQLSFPPEQQHHLQDTQLKKEFTQYVCSNTSSPSCDVRKSDLNRGLLAVSVNCLDGKGYRMMLCKMECGKEDDGNCYMSQDESLLLRFEDNKLSSITINHASLASLPISELPLQRKSFLEYSLTSDLYKSHMTRTQFDTMLLSKGKVGRWVRKQSQKALTKTKCGMKRLQAIQLKPIMNSYVQSFLVEKVNPEMKEEEAQLIEATIKHLDKSCRELESIAVMAKRFSVVTKHGDAIRVYKFEINSSSGSDRASAIYDRHHIMEIELFGQAKLAIHLHGVNRKSTLYSYYGLSGLDLYLFTFDSMSGKLQYIYGMRSESHIGRKIKYSKVNL